MGALPRRDSQQSCVKLGFQNPKKRSHPIQKRQKDIMKGVTTTNTITQIPNLYQIIYFVLTKTNPNKILKVKRLIFFDPFRFFIAVATKLR
jgi:hypothetical protein